MPKKFTHEEYVQNFNKFYPTLELLSEYNGDKNYIQVKCRLHDYIFQTKPNWLKQGRGCQKCYDDRRGSSMRKTKEHFIIEAQEIHGNKYDYSKVEYINNHIKVCIICLEHGEFWQTPNKHLLGQGCPRCSAILNGLNKRLSLDAFIQRSKEMHGDKYDYSNVNFENVDKSVKIICPTHGVFEQSPYSHMKGNGCPLCNESILERRVAFLLEGKGIKFERQKKFEWLGLQSLDFYLLDYNIAIECQGKQHFNSVDYFGGDNGFNIILERDERKYKLCQENGVKIKYVVLDMIDVDTSISKIYDKGIYVL